MTSAMPAADFPKFQLLKDICSEHHDPSELREYDITEQILRRSLFPRVGSYNIRLKILVDAPSTEPRIELNGLINLLSDPKYQIVDDMCLSIVLSSGEEGQADTITASMTVRNLRRRSFLRFTHLLDKLPEDRWPYATELVMDRNGDFTDPAPGVPYARVVSWSCGVGNEDFNHVTDRIEDRFDGLYKRHRCWSHSRDGCMACAWDGLRLCIERRWGSWEGAVRRQKLRTTEDVKA